MVKHMDPIDENYQKDVHAKYLNDNKVELYKKFPLKNRIGYSTFCKYLNLCNEFKSPMRLTDLCDYCERAKLLKVIFTFFNIYLIYLFIYLYLDLKFS